MSRNLKLRLLTALINRIAASAIAPFMALYFATQKDVAFASGAMALQVAVGYTSSLLGGYFGDKKDEQTLLFNWQMIHAVSQLIVGIVIFAKGSLYLVAGVYMVSVVASNFYKSTFKSLLVASVTSQNRKKAYTIDYISTNISIIIGAVIGGIAFGGFEYLLFFGSTLSIAVVALVLRLGYKRTSTGAIGKETDSKFGAFKFFVSVLRNYKLPFMDTQFRKYVIAMGLFQSLGYSVSSTVLVGLQQRKTVFRLNVFNNDLRIKTSQLYGLLQGVNIVIVVLFSFAAVNTFKKMSTKVKIIIFGTLMAATYGVLNLPVSFMAMLVAMAFGAVFEIIVVPEIQGLEVDLIPIEHKATYIAFDSLESYIDQAVSALSLAVLSLGTTTTALFVFGIGVLGSVIIANVASSVTQKVTSNL